MKIITLTFSIMFCLILPSQENEIKHINKGDFPSGIYRKLSDVLNMRATSTEELYYKTCDKCDSTDLPEKAFFYKKKSKSKLLFPLAVSYNGELYIQTYRKYTNKKDRKYDPDAYSRFCKVVNYGRFIYFEESMRGKWGKWILGGLHPTTYLIKGKIKGIVLDLENQEFNILKDCADLNEFLSSHNLEKISCDESSFPIAALRNLIDNINIPYR